MADLRSLISDTLAAHRGRFGVGLNCSCRALLTNTPAEHRSHVADAILSALDGQLLPEGGQTREEWRVAGYSARNGNFTAVLAFPETEEEALAEATPADWSPLGYDARAEVCTVTSWPDGQQHRSSWRPVESEETAAGGETP